MSKVKVVVLGGGVGGVVAAMRLTATPQLRQRFDVTLHQPGWRLGGKGASGRNAALGDRIEEHGLHMWFGFYDNAFREMRAAYEELGRPAGSPLATVEDAFHPSDTVVMYDREPGGWRSMPVTLPDNDASGARPGDGHALPTLLDIVAFAADKLGVGWAGLGLGAAPGKAALPLWLAPFGSSVDDVLKALAGMIAGAANGLPLLIPGLKIEEAVADGLDAIRDLAWVVCQVPAQTDAQVRLYFCALDVLAATMRGIVDDGVLHDPDGFACVNGLDLTDWLVSHGLTEISAGATPPQRTPLLRAIYDLAFAYVDGDVDRPSADAGTAVSDAMRLLFTYRGHVGYKMQAGMGDAVFAPFYEVLRARGVTFEFFSAATAIRLDPKADVVSEIDVVAQTDLVAGPYDPLVDVGGLPCWPSEPQWAQLVDGAKHHAAGVDFEGDLNPLGRTARTLVRGTDFDEVVLAVSPGGLGPLTTDLVQRSASFAAAMQTVGLVQTQAFQFWLTKDSAALGYTHGPASVAGTFTEPLDTYCDMTHLIERESWPAGEVGSIAYFCGVLDHRKETHAQATDRVRQNMEAFLDADATGIFPLAMAGAGPQMDCDLLVASGPLQSAKGKARAGAQYWRANTTGTELYVITPAGTVKDRLPSGDTGIDNLVAAGDWTANGIDGGCVEAATISGVDAANAVVERHRQPGEPPPAPPTFASTTWLRI